MRPADPTLYPSEIVICDQVFDVVWCDELKGADGSNLWGEINYTSGEIRLVQPHTESHARVCLLHEIIHGCSDIGNLDLDERQITVLAYLLSAVLRHNPQLVSLYKEGLDISRGVGYY
jgi:hypothetical protein